MVWEISPKSCQSLWSFCLILPGQPMYNETVLRVTFAICLIAFLAALAFSLLPAQYPLAVLPFLSPEAKICSARNANPHRSNIIPVWEVTNALTFGIICSSCAGGCDEFRVSFWELGVRGLECIVRCWEFIVRGGEFGVLILSLRVDS